MLQKLLVVALDSEISGYFLANLSSGTSVFTSDSFVTVNFVRSNVFSVNGVSQKYCKTIIHYIWVK